MERSLVIKAINTTLVILPLMVMSVAHAATIYVPRDHSRIKDAILYALPGDEIVVSPGVYHEVISFLRQDIVVRSTFNGDWSVVKNTVIEGDMTANVIGFTDSETSHCVLRGFTIRNGIGGIVGNGTHATIEYNIIEYNRSVHGQFGVMASGGAIQRCNGLIQNNIFRYNQANYGGALADCQGTIQNNLFYQNITIFGTSKPQNPRSTPQQGAGVIDGAGGAMINCNGTIRNNTIVDNYNVTPVGFTPGGLKDCKGSIVNNIIYHTTMTTTLEFDGNSSATYCLFRTAHVGKGNVTGDPKFVDPARGDYHVKSDSPAIDAGKRFDDETADFDGHQRALKSNATTKGDGSGADIGAYENLPKPVAIWLPNGGPPGGARDGHTLSVSWTMDPPAGTKIRLALRKGQTLIRDLGQFTSTTGSATSTVTLPAMLYTGSDYLISGASVTSATLASATASFKITGSNHNAVDSRVWEQYY